MSKVTIDGLEDLRARAGKPLGESEWKTMEMAQVKTFAEATGDHQWIHVDEERARRESPFKRPIAHGYLSLSLTAGAFFEVIELRGFDLVVNYGSNKVRFPAPLGVGDRYRVAFALGEVKEVGNGFTEAIFTITVEIEGQSKPACVAEVVHRLKAGS